MIKDEWPELQDEMERAAESDGNAAREGYAKLTEWVMAVGQRALLDTRRPHDVRDCRIERRTK